MGEDHEARPASVLVVDDDADICLLIERALKANGTTDVLSLPSAEQAIPLLERRAFDVLITDKLLPGMDGHALIDAARALHPHIGVVMITARGTMESSARGFRQRIDYYILKPFEDISDFVDVVASAYRVHAHIRALEQARDELDRLLGKKR